jgi:microcystin-dependent protein
MGLSSALGGAGAVPVGVVNPFAGATAPSGWLLCYGQAVSRTQYPVLFTTLSTTYGVGDGSTTFNIPDMRGRVVAGEDDMGGTAASRLTSAVSGVAGGTLGAVGGNQTMHAHSHTNTVTNNAVTTAGVGNHTHNTPYPIGWGGSGYGSAFSSSVSPDYSTTSGNGAHDHTVTSNVTITNATFPATAGGSSQNVQPTIVLNYIIKAL